jgi:hypothetical protein
MERDRPLSSSRTSGGQIGAPVYLSRSLSLGLIRPSTAAYLSEIGRETVKKICGFSPGRLAAKPGRTEKTVCLVHRRHKYWLSCITS